jgi:hypothetical protein
MARRGTGVNDGVGLDLSTGAIATARVVIALVGAALLGLDLALRRANAGEPTRRLRNLLLLATAAAAVLAWTHFAPIALLSRVHVWELYHHVLGAKYFPELGYTRLYECTVIADAEAGFSFPIEQRPLRRLVDNKIETGARVAADPDSCKKHFSPERWRAFARDLEPLRSVVSAPRWRNMLIDHGFNASPVWTVGGRAVIPAAPLNWPRLRALARIDLALLALMFVATFWGFGLRAGSTALNFFGTHHLGDISWIGGGLRRYDWLATAVIGAALVRRGHLAAGGFALTWSTLLRVFPGFLVAAVVLHAAIDLARRRSLSLSAAHRSFALGCLLALGTLLPLSVVVAGPNAWPEFVENSRKHLSTPLVNFVGWKSVVAFDPATTSALVNDHTLDDKFEPWHAAQRANFEQRQWVYWAGVAAFVLLLGAALVRTSIGVAPLLGVGLVVVAAQIGSYYYALLLGYGLLGASFEAIGIGLLLVSAASLGIADARTGSAEILYVALSALWLLFAVAATAFVAWRGERERG